MTLSVVLLYQLQREIQRSNFQWEERGPFRRNVGCLQMGQTIFHLKKMGVFGARE